MAKAKLRHIAISVPDKETAAKFYEETFGFERVSHSRVATRLSDGGNEHHTASIRDPRRCR
jgi:catechol-2,3-dioxygenase